MRFNTLLIHGGRDGDPTTGAVNVPVYLTSTFRQTAPGKASGYEYSRTGNPTREALELLVAELEGGRRGLAFASGMAAISTVLLMFSSGDHFVLSDDVYGGTFRVMDKVFSRMGLEASFVDTSDIAALERAFTPRTRAVLVETPTNPLLKVTDLRRVAELARARGALLVVDNTFLSPYLQRPLLHGADAVVHSATKYLGGHSDIVAGVLVTREAELGERLHFLQNAVGAVLGPCDSWLTIRGIKTLGVRMEAHQRAALTLAGWLKGRKGVNRVFYPGLPDHAGYATMKEQASGFGGMLSFETETDQQAMRVLTGVKVFTLAESLGGVESLINLPSRMTHASIPPRRREELGISDRLVRLSVGLEDVDDLIEDLDQALG